jgi:uncharacterized protein (TIGR03118 family)
MRRSRFALSGFLMSCYLIISLGTLAGSGSVAKAASFEVKNLVTNDQSVNPALLTDPSLVNPWGVSFGATSPFWVSDNGTGVSTLYRVDPISNLPVKVGLTVSIPGDGSVTGQVANGNAAAFNGNAFLFVNEDGTISGWRGALGTQAEILRSPSDAVYKGAAIATISGNTYLYAANFHSGAIDVLKGTTSAPDLTGKFADPNLPANYAPFNIQILGGKIYVSYALQGAGKDEMAGPGLGIVNVFDTQGNLLGRVASNGPNSPLNAPWGMAIAPSSFGSFAGDLLVGNFGNGTINAFNLTTNTFDGQLRGFDGNPLSIQGLWALTVGNNGGAGNSQTLYFSAGPNDEEAGLFGLIQTVPEPSSVVLALIAVTAVATCKKVRYRKASA